MGGTDLNLNSNGTISSETAWEPQNSGGQVWSGGGGVSVEFSGRDVPDVSYNAGVGYAIYDSFDGTGGWIDVGGTSAGIRNGPRSSPSPIKAGLSPVWARLDDEQPRNPIRGICRSVERFPRYHCRQHAIRIGGRGLRPGHRLGHTRCQSVDPIFRLVQRQRYDDRRRWAARHQLPPPLRPISTASSVSTSQINLSWTNSNGASGYKVTETRKRLRRAHRHAGLDRDLGLRYRFCRQARAIHSRFRHTTLLALAQPVG